MLPGLVYPSGHGMLRHDPVRRNSAWRGALRGMIEDKPLPAPVEISLGGGSHRLATVREAYDFLTTHWPEDARGSRFDEATGACLKVLDGHRSAVDAADALRAAADEAGITVRDAG